MQPGKPVANEASRLLCLCPPGTTAWLPIAFSRMARSSASWRDDVESGVRGQHHINGANGRPAAILDSTTDPRETSNFVRRRRVAFAAAKRSALSTLLITCIAGETCGVWSTTFSTMQAEVTRRIVAALALE